MLTSARTHATTTILSWLMLVLESRYLLILHPKCVIDAEIVLEQLVALAIEGPC